ncbi:hypothetical protein [Aquimarina spinulae]|uniref:hypothetical protein n=1 Tax=Aquimarina spinulae TaxID=1192023 RepID=UPI000D5628C0|nr:hypothetical protein [Aquimarina spinulae]
MKKIVLLLFVTFLSINAKAQTAKISLTAKKIKKSLYLRLDNKDILRYGTKAEEINQKTPKTKTFASNNESITIYIKPLNPITKEITVNNKTIENTNFKESQEVLSQIISTINKTGQLSLKANPNPNQNKLTFNDIVDKTVIHINQINYDNYQNIIDSIETNIGKLKKIVSIKSKTLNKNNNLNSNLLEWYKATKNYEKEVEIIVIIKNYYDQLKTWTEKMSKNNFDELQPVDDLAKDSIKVVEISISDRILEYDASKKVLSLKKQEKPITENILNFEKFSRFIPEVVPAIVYTDLSFPQYGTETNDNDEQILVKTDDKSFNKINVGLMVNFNYNMGYDEFIPFFQIGAGPTKKFPILFSGVGMRLNNRFMISGGTAWTWINELSSLNVGDVISGTAEIENDQAFKFRTTPKFYFSLQIKI